MQRDWVQYFKDRANAVITQPDDFAPVIQDQAPQMPDFSKIASPEKLLNAAVLTREFASLATRELLTRVMVKH